MRLTKSMNKFVAAAQVKHISTITAGRFAYAMVERRSNAAWFRGARRIRPYIMILELFGRNNLIVIRSVDF